jgi:hypothetical protein
MKKLLIYKQGREGMWFYIYFGKISVPSVTVDVVLFCKCEGINSFTHPFFGK